MISSTRVSFAHMLVFTKKIHLYSYALVYSPNCFTSLSLQNEAHNVTLPTLRFVEKKVQELENSKNVNLKEEDIDKVKMCV